MRKKAGQKREKGEREESAGHIEIRESKAGQGETFGPKPF